MTDPAATIRNYLAAWNQTNPNARLSAIQSAFTPDVRYADPLIDVTGRDGLDAAVAAVHTQFPGMVFTPLGEADAHHDVCRFGWALGPAGDEPAVVGFDVVVLASDGRIAAVHGFLDKVPA